LLTVTVPALTKKCPAQPAPPPPLKVGVAGVAAAAVAVGRVRLLVLTCGAVVASAGVVAGSHADEKMRSPVVLPVEPPR